MNETTRFHELTQRIARTCREAGLALEEASDEALGLIHLGELEYHLSRGGFAPLVHDTDLETLEIYAEMLAGIRADGTLRFVREAIRMLGSRPREYAEFLERDFTDDSQLKNDLHGLSLALHVSVPSVAAEFEAYVATISPVVEGWLATLKTR